MDLRILSDYYDEPIKITQLRHRADGLKYKLSTGFGKTGRLDTTNMCKIINEMIVPIGANFNRESLFIFCGHYILISAYIDYNKFFNIIGDKINHICIAEYIIDEYSPLGAVIVNYLNLSLKRDFISKLMRLGFMPTQHDIELNALILYDAIPNLLKHVIVLLLHNIDLLNRDIRAYIINILLHELMINNCPLI